MENFQIFIKNVQEFYGLLEKVSSGVEDLLKKSVKPCSSITNQCLILTSLLQNDSLQGTGLENLSGFKFSLSCCILNSLKREFNLLVNIRKEITVLDDDLLQKYKSVENSFRQIKKKDLVHISILNPISPRLEHIVDWSLDTWRYYHSLNLQISQAVENLDFENEDTVVNLFEAFKEDKSLKKYLNKIRGFEFQKFQFIG